MVADASLLLPVPNCAHIGQDHRSPCFRGLSLLLFWSSDYSNNLQHFFVFKLTKRRRRQVSADLGHPAGDMDDDLVSMMLRRASELTGNGSSCLRMAEFLDLTDKMQASGK